MTTKATLNIGAKWFEENKQRFLEAANKNLESEDKDSEYEIEVTVDCVDWSFDEGEKEYLGYITYDDDDARVKVWIDSPLETNHKIRIAESLIKTLNKAKALLESLK